jgi:hypothetical protein
MPLRASSYMLTLCNLMVPDIKSDKRELRERK